MPARAAPRAAGRCRRRSARGSAPSCRGRCGRRCPSVSGRGAHPSPSALRGPRRPRRPISVLGRACAGRAARGRRGRGRPPEDHRPRSGASSPGVGSAGQRHRRALELEQRQRAAADLRGCRARRSPPAPIPARSRRARAASVVLAASSIASTGISRRARRGSRYSAQRRLERGQRQLVDPQRARERVRARGGDRVGAARRSARPAGRRAACRPSSTRARRPPPPSAADAARRRAARIPAGVGQHPGADVVDHRRRRARTAPRSATSSTKPTVRKFDWCTRRIAPDRGARRAAARARSRASRVRLVVPTSTSVAPDCAITSGIRKPPPISTSWPRETTTPAARPGQRRRGEQDGGGAVVDGDRRLGAGQLAQQRLDVGVAASRGSPVARSSSRFAYPAARAPRRRARRRPAARGRGWCGRSRRSR